MSLTMRTSSGPDSLPAQGIRVLLVDASEKSRAYLLEHLRYDGHIEMAHAVGDGTAALAFINNAKGTGQPVDVVLMDNQLPQLDGFETTRRIMETCALPIVMCTRPHDADEALFRAMEAGAVACAAKPSQDGDPELARVQMDALIRTLRLMSEVKVVRRWGKTGLAPRARAATNGVNGNGGGNGNGNGHANGETSSASIGASDMPVAVKSSQTLPCMVGIGASTGGPLVLQTILAALPRDFPWPILVVQHISRGFLPGMVEWLRQTSGPTVQIGAYGIRPEPGHVYLAPDDFQMGLSPAGRIVLSREPGDGGLRPSVSYMFRTLADLCGPNAIGVLLTGMGRDGAAEIKLIKDLGGTTLVQDSATSVVHGMPGTAIALGGATHVLAADRIAEMLVVLARRAQRAQKEKEKEPPARVAHSSTQGEDTRGNL